MPTYKVVDWVDTFHLQQQAMKLAEKIGFSRRECGELAIVASELVSNILKYGVRGTLEMDWFSDSKGAGITMIASDQGPPFHDLESALRDGWNDRGPIDPLHLLKRKGIGGGLGAITRLTHSFQVEPLPVGKKVHVVKYLKPRRTRRPPAPKTVPPARKTKPPGPKTMPPKSKSRPPAKR